MNFQETLKAQLANQNYGDREPVDYPSNHLKNKELYFPKQAGNQAPTLLVRILPPAPGVGDGNFNVPAREIFLQTQNSNGKDLKLNAVLSPFPNQEDPLDMAITQWQAENRVPNSYNRQAKPSNRYYVNAVNIVVNPQTGQYEEERDPQTGQLVVRLLKLTHSACNGILEKLTDPMFAPQALQGQPMEVAQYSFISSMYAFPIRLTKPLKNSGQMSYGVDIMTQFPLGALPQGWENLLEDLQYQATPSVQYNFEYVDYFIKVVNGEEPVQGQNQTQAQPTQGYGAPAPTYTQPATITQPGFPQGSQPAYTQQATQPVQPQATNMGTATYGQTNMNTAPDINAGLTQQPAPIANPNGVQQPMYQQPAPQVDTMPVPPAPTQNVPVVDDTVLPQDLTSAPDVAPAPTGVTPPPQMPQADPAPQTTPAEPTQTEMPDIEDLINRMQQGV